MNKTLIVIAFLLFAVTIGIVAGILSRDYRRAQNIKSEKVVESPVAKIEGRGFMWGATIRPFAISAAGAYQDSDIEQQFRYLVDLFPHNACARANIETNMQVNDSIVAYKQKYGTSLYFILEEIKDFNQNIDYKKSAADLAQKIVARYKGKVEYYQLSNELSGVMYSPPEEQTEKLDGGYGLSISKTRYEHVRDYTVELSRQIRALDPDAKIIISGHWVLIKPVMQLVQDGVQADIIGWNWGSGNSDQPAIKNIDNYGKMDIPQMAHDAGKDFWIVEANYDNGSANGQESQQGAYIRTLAQNSYNNKNVGGYFHFILTDAMEDGPVGQLGLVTIKKESDQRARFYSLKSGYHVLKNYAQNHF